MAQLTKRDDLLWLKHLEAVGIDVEQGQAVAVEVNGVVIEFTPARDQPDGMPTKALVPTGANRDLWIQIPKKSLVEIGRVFVAGGELEPARRRSPEAPQPKTKQPGRPAISSERDATVFIIHGQNGAAVQAIIDFIHCLGLRPVTFDDVSKRLGGSPYIGQVLKEGMDAAGAIVALFTPDEYAGLDPRLRHEDTREATRWQARPNVIFEAGMALGARPEDTILVTLGPMKLFTDLDGRHVVRLDNAPDRRNLLQSRLALALRARAPSDRWLSEKTGGGDFEKCLLGATSPREPFGSSYDEISHLLGELDAQPVYEKSLLDLLAASAKAYPDWTECTAANLLAALKDRFNNSSVEAAYWWLLVYGVLRFKGISKWWPDGNDPSWEVSVKYAQLAERGIVLMNQLARR